MISPIELKSWRSSSPFTSLLLAAGRREDSFGDSSPLAKRHVFRNRYWRVVLEHRRFPDDVLLIGVNYDPAASSFNESQMIDSEATFKCMYTGHKICQAITHISMIARLNTQ